MCGIFFCCTRNGPQFPSQICLESLCRRGPDNKATVSRLVTLKSALPRSPSSEQEKQSISITFVLTVLSLRGDLIVSQPLQDQQSGFLFCWNGEAWRVGEKTIRGNDAEFVFNHFLQCFRNPSYDDVLQNIVSLVSSITGPFSFVFYDARHHRVFYGRDALGRRSLVVRNSLPGGLVISSICDAADPEHWTEVEADGIYILDLQEALIESQREIAHIPWSIGKPESELPITLVRPFFVPFILLRH